MNELEHQPEKEGGPEGDAAVSETPAASRNRKAIWIAGSIFALAVVVVGLIWALALRGSADAEAGSAEAEENAAGRVAFLMEQQWLIRMKLAKAEERTVSKQITSVGRVVPASNSQAIVAAPVSGLLVDRRLPRIGEFVSGGQALGFVRQVPTSAEAAQARAAADQVEISRSQLEMQKMQIAVENARLESEKRAVQGDVEMARIRLEEAARNADRVQRLYDGKAASLRQLQAAQSEKRSAESALASAEKRLDALQKTGPVAVPGSASKRTAGISNGFTVSAPFSGYVTKVNKAIGEQVAAGEAIVEISDLNTVWIEAPIFERELNALGSGSTATFTVSAYPREFRGTVIDIGATIDESTRSAKVVFEVDNSGRALRLGMQANVRLDGEQEITAVMIPKEAVLEAEGKYLVYVLISGEEFERREVTVGDEYGGEIAILGGVKPGERVVTQGAYQLRLQELRPADAGAHSHET